MYCATATLSDKNDFLFADNWFAVHQKKLKIWKQINKNYCIKVTKKTEFPGCFSLYLYLNRQGLFTENYIQYYRILLPAMC